MKKTFVFAGLFAVVLLACCANEDVMNTINNKINVSEQGSSVESKKEDVNLDETTDSLVSNENIEEIISDTDAEKQVKERFFIAITYLKDLDVQGLSTCFSKNNKKIYDAVVPQLYAQIPEKFISTIKNFTSSIKCEILNIEINEDNTIDLTTKIKLFERNLFTKFIPSYIKNEIQLKINFVKENGEYKINNFNDIMDDINREYEDVPELAEEDISLYN